MYTGAGVSYETATNLQSASLKQVRKAVSRSGAAEVTVTRCAGDSYVVGDITHCWTA